MEEIEEALAILEGRNFIRKLLRVTASGRPSEKYEVSPLALQEGHCVTTPDQKQGYSCQNQEDPVALPVPDQCVLTPEQEQQATKRLLMEKRSEIANRVKRNIEDQLRAQVDMTMVIVEETLLAKYVLSPEADLEQVLGVLSGHVQRVAVAPSKLHLLPPMSQAAESA